MKPMTQISTTHLNIQSLKLNDTKRLLDYEKTYEPYLQRWQPLRNSNYFSIEATERRVEESVIKQNQGNSITFFGNVKKRRSSI